MKRAVIILSVISLIAFILGQIGIAADTKETNLRSRVKCQQAEFLQCIEEKDTACMYTKGRELVRLRNEHDQFVQHTLIGKLFASGLSIDESLKIRRFRANGFDDQTMTYQPDQ